MIFHIKLPLESSQPRKIDCSWLNEKQRKYAFKHILSLRFKMPKWWISQINQLYVQLNVTFWVDNILSSVMRYEHEVSVDKVDH